MRYSWLGSRPQTVAIEVLKLLQSSQRRVGGVRLDVRISIVAMRSCWMTASCRNSANVRGMMVGL
jgi:hypothetical protein